jgi:hypothetical protein
MRTVYLPLAVPCVRLPGLTLLDCRTYGCPLLAAYDRQEECKCALLCVERASAHLQEIAALLVREAEAAA